MRRWTFRRLAQHLKVRGGMMTAKCQALRAGTVWDLLGAPRRPRMVPEPAMPPARKRSRVPAIGTSWATEVVMQRRGNALRAVSPSLPAAVAKAEGRHRSILLVVGSVSDSANQSRPRSESEHSQALSPLFIRAEKLGSILLPHPDLRLLERLRRPNIMSVPSVASRDCTLSRPPECTVKGCQLQLSHGR